MHNPERTFVSFLRHVLIAGLVAAPLSVAFGPSAWAQDDARIGVGASALISQGTTTLPSAGSLSFVYDMRQFRVEGLLSLLAIEDNRTSFGLGGRFFYVLHMSDQADFSVGGGLGISHTAPEVGDSVTRFFLEGSGQIRFFPVSAVAVHGGLGLGASFGRGGFVFNLGSNLFGTFGLTYFF